jgi:hypothetical protein
MYISVSAVRGYARDYGTIAYVLGLTTLIVIWFACDYLCFVLLVPTVARKVLVASSAVSALCHLGLATWALFYMPSALSSQASQFGPIGVTFSLFTLFLANVVVLLCAPLVVTVWQERRHGVIRRVVPE